MDKLFLSPCSNTSTFCSEVERSKKADFNRKPCIPHSTDNRTNFTTESRNIPELNPTFKRTNTHSKINDAANNVFSRKRPFTQEPISSRPISTYNSVESGHILPPSQKSSDRKFRISSPPKKIANTQPKNTRPYKIFTHEIGNNFPSKHSGYRTNTFPPKENSHIYPLPMNSQDIKQNFDTMSITSEDVFNIVDREIELHRKRKEAIISQQHHKPPLVHSQRKPPCCPCSHYHQDDINKRTSVVSQPRSSTHRATQTKSNPEETDNSFKLTKDQIKSIASFFKINPDKMQLVAENVTKGKEIGEGVSESEDDDSSDDVIPASQSPVKRRYLCKAIHSMCLSDGKLSQM